MITAKTSESMRSPLSWIDLKVEVFNVGRQMDS